MRIIIAPIFPGQPNIRTKRYAKQIEFKTYSFT